MKRQSASKRAGAKAHADDHAALQRTLDAAHKPQIHGTG
jgi:hypothetical protein